MTSTTMMPMAPLLVDALSAARLLGISRTTWYGQLSAGRAPPGCRLGRCRRWSVVELEKWSAAGCPPMAKWDGGAP